MKPEFAKILKPSQAASLAKRLKAARKKIVFTNGCFDILHAGHVKLLNFSRRQGDVLILGVNSDSSVRYLKGPGRPVNRLADRLSVLSALRFVDFLVPFSEATPARLIASIRPHVLVKGSDWKTGQIAGAADAGRVVLFPLVSGRSTTKIIEKARKIG